MGTKIPHESCHYIDVPKCHNVPQEHCSAYTVPKCHKVPEQYCTKDTRKSVTMSLSKSPSRRRNTNVFGPSTGITPMTPNARCSSSIRQSISINISTYTILGHYFIYSAIQLQSFCLFLCILIPFSHTDFVSKYLLIFMK